MSPISSIGALVCGLLVTIGALMLTFSCPSVGAMQLADADQRSTGPSASLAVVENPEITARVLESLLRSVVYSSASELQPFSNKMKAQMVLLVATAILASLLLVSCDQDAGCRNIANDIGIPIEQIESVKRFTLYGQPAYPKTCKDACEAHGKSIGFDFYGKQACCCGKPETS